MSISTRNTLKGWFKRGLKPLEIQFASWLDSYWHKNEDAIPQANIAGLVDILNSLAPLTAIDDLKGGVGSGGDTLKKLYDLIIGIGQFAGDHDASGGALPAVGTGESGAIDKSDYWVVSVAGTIAGLGDVKAGDVIYARINNAAVAADFFVVEKNQDQATDTVMGLVKLYTNLAASNTDGAASQAAVKAVVDLLATIIAVQNSTYTGASVTGTDTYTAVLAPAITAYVKGQRFELTDVIANTVTNPTINFNGLGVKNLLDYKGAALTVGVFTGTVIVMYDGAAFRMIGGGGSGGGGTAATTTFTPAGNIAATDVQAALQELDTEKQPLDSELTALAALVSAADQLPYFNGSGSAALTSITAFARAFLALNDPAAIRYFKVNADNTISFRTAAEMLADLGAEASVNKGAANGYAPLGADSKVPAAYIADNHFKGKYATLIALQAAHPTASDGDYAIVDTGSGSNAKEYIWDADEGWIQSSGTSVASGVTLTPYGNIGSSNVQAAIQELDYEKANDAQVVKLTGDQTIAGVKTFESFPVTPSANPTTQYQAANKGYVDAVASATALRNKLAYINSTYLITR